MIEHSSGLRRGLIHARQNEIAMRTRYAHLKPTPRRRAIVVRLLLLFSR